jgi:LacI family transcriptional regulator
MRALLQCDPRPDAVFCYNDPIAIGATNTILEAGLRVPEDIALVGCGNLHYDDWLRVPLSSIDQHSAQIGQRAGEILLQMIEEREWPVPEQVVLEPKLVIRESTVGKKAPRSKAVATKKKVRSR